MHKKFLTLFGVLLITGVFLFSNNTFAQYSLGVHWVPPEDTERAVDELTRFQKMGITHLEVTTTLDDTLWAEIELNDFTVFGRLPIRYPVINTFSQPDSSLLQSIRSYVDHFNRRPGLAAIGLFEFGQVNRPAFAETIGMYLQQIRMVSPAEIYYKASSSKMTVVDSLFDFKMWEVIIDDEFMALDEAQFNRNKQIPVYSYRPVKAYKRLLEPLKKFMDLTSDTDESIVFFDSVWLLDMQEKYPSLTTIFNSYADVNEPIFPLPEERRPASSSHSIAVILLLLIWGIGVIIYHTEPIYRKSLFRYFTAHKFFVSDVMGRHIRSNLPSIIILFQHAFTGGLWLYCLGNYFLSIRGFEALTYYFPFLLFANETSSSLIISGVLLTLLFSLLCILWLRFLIPSIRQMNQALILYAWPLQINLVVVTLMVLLLLTGSGTVYMVSAGILWVLIFLGSFVVTSVETSRFVKHKRMLIIFGTAGLYLAGITALILWALGNSMFVNVLRLSVSLS